MEITDKQFQEFVRSSEMSLNRIVEILQKDLPEDNPGRKEAEQLLITFQSMLEDGI